MNDYHIPQYAYQVREWLNKHYPAFSKQWRKMKAKQLFAVYKKKRGGAWTTGLK